MSLLAIDPAHPHASEPVGLYVHVPFCARLCSYCDFYKLEGRPEVHAAFVEALAREISAMGRELASHGVTPRVDSIYLGGGTPTSLGAPHLDRILRDLERSFQVDAFAEVTVECNPDDATPELLGGLVASGCDRISIGVQSLDEAELRLLGRTHSAAGARAAVAIAREAGFANVSVDVIVGLPGQTEAGALRTIEGTLALRPSHVSAYLLELDKETPIRRSIESGMLPAPGDEESAAIYRSVGSALAGAGLPAYEISSFAPENRRSRHNLKYWTDAPYLGFGPSAASYWGNRRMTRRPSLTAFLEDAGRLEPRSFAVEERSGDAALADALMLGLRARDGVSVGRLVARHGGSGRLNALLEEMIADGLLERAGERIRIGDELLPVANFVFERLVG
ncbi:MAG: radical SAM family heme chaperone HemW [Acidobacteriota bacterium]